MNCVDRRNVQLRGGRSTKDAGLRTVSMHDVGPQVLQRPNDAAIAGPVAPRMQTAPHLGDLDDTESGCPGTFGETALWTERRPGDESDFVSEFAMLVFTRKDRVLLSAADDQPGNDVSNVHE